MFRIIDTRNGMPIVVVPTEQEALAVWNVLTPGMRACAALMSEAQYELWLSID